MKIAVLLTCFNRKEKTLSCLSSLYNALSLYNDKNENKIEISVYLTDDGCTDGTGDAIRNNFPNKDITILQGTGNLYWAGGMRFAWNEALKKHNEWDFYLLLNDDTCVIEDCLFTLMYTDEYSKSKLGKQGIYSGITCDPNNNSKITYGGRKWKNYFWGTTTILVPNGEPQLCDETNANILLVSKIVVDQIGIFWEGYSHIGADFDYAIQCNKRNIPTFVTGKICGYCKNDHRSASEERDKIKNMTLQERRNYFNHPLHLSKDRNKFKKRNTPLRYPFGVIGRFLNLYFPKLYYKISDFRR